MQAQKPNSYLIESAESKNKIDRRGFLKKTAQLGGLATLTKVLSSCNGGGNGNGNNHTIYDILTTWRANYTLEGTEATGIVKYYEGGTYNEETNSGTLVETANLKDQVNLGTTIDNGTKSFDVVVEAEDGLRKVYKNIAMSRTKEYYDQKEGVLKKTDFNLEEFVDKFLLGNRNDRWRQNKVDLVFNPDISASGAYGTELFKMSDFMPRDKFTSRESALRNGLSRAKVNIERYAGSEGVTVIYDGYNSSEKWAKYLKKNISYIKEIKFKDDVSAEELKKLKKQSSVINLTAERLPQEWIDKTVESVEKIINNSAGFITDYSVDENGDKTAADAPPPNGACWVFYDSAAGGVRNIPYPTQSDGPVDANILMFDPERAIVAQVEHETIDSFFRDNQNPYPNWRTDHYDRGWLKFSFMRPTEDSYKITKTYEKRDGVDTSVSVQEGEAVGVQYRSPSPLFRNPLIPERPNKEKKDTTPLGEYLKRKIDDFKKDLKIEKKKVVK